MGEETKKWTVELCLSCMVQMEDAGYELQAISTGMVKCENCGARCWGKAFRVHKARDTEAEA